jgi:hypothetical protein
MVLDSWCVVENDIACENRCELHITTELSENHKSISGGS